MRMSEHPTDTCCVRNSSTMAKNERDFNYGAENKPCKTMQICSDKPVLTIDFNDFCQLKSVCFVVCFLFQIPKIPEKYKHAMQTRYSNSFHYHTNQQYRSNEKQLTSNQLSHSTAENVHDQCRKTPKFRNLFSSSQRVHCRVVTARAKFACFPLITAKDLHANAHAW